MSRKMKKVLILVAVAAVAVVAAVVMPVVFMPRLVVPLVVPRRRRLGMADDLWESLNAANRISLYVRYVDLKTGAAENRLINKNK